MVVGGDAADNKMEGASTDLYASLGVQKDASAAEIRKAYQRLAMKLHPDKNPSDEDATAKFQALQRIYEVLSDEERRKLYDETGCIDGGGDEDTIAQFYSFFRQQFKEVKEEDVVDFENQYRGSDEELRDLLQLYERFHGDMKQLFDWMICSRPKIDSHRFRDAIRAAISERGSGIKEHKRFTKWASKVDATPAPTVDPLKPSVKKKRTASGAGGGSDLGALALAIRGNAANREDDLISRLEAKYGGSSSQKKKKRKKTGSK